MGALHDASARFCDLVGSLGPEDAARPVTGLDWTVGDTVAHVLTVVRRGFADRRRSAAAAETAALNEVCLEETPERDPSVLARRLRADVHTALDVVFPKIACRPRVPVPRRRHHDDDPRAARRARRVRDPRRRHRRGDRPAVVDQRARGDAPRPRRAARRVAAGRRSRRDVPPAARHRGAAVLRDPRRRLSVRSAAPAPGGGGGGNGVTVIAMDPVAFVLGFYNRVPVHDAGLLRLRSRFVPA